MSEHTAEYGRCFRWDWVVVLAGFVVLAVLANFLSDLLVGVVIGGGYVLGRWDSTYGEQYRDERPR